MNVVVHQQVLAPMLKTDHLTKPVGVCYEETLIMTWKVYLLH